MQRVHTKYEGDSIAWGTQKQLYFPFFKKLVLSDVFRFAASLQVLSEASKSVEMRREIERSKAFEVDDILTDDDSSATAQGN